MNRSGSSPLSSLIIGLAVGAVAVTVYRNRASLIAASSTPLAPPLSSGSRSLGAPTMSHVRLSTDSVMRALTSAVDRGPSGLVEQARHYLESVRARVDAAIAEGRLTAEQTRTELEGRLAQAKVNPASARSPYL